MVLGPERTLPLTPAVLEVASLNVYAVKRNYTVTHYYIRFDPSNDAELAALFDWELDSGVDLYDYPLHHEVIHLGEKYVDPYSTNAAYTSWYGSAPVDSDLSKVSHTILEEVVLTEENPFILAEAYRITDNTDLIRDHIVGDGISVSYLKENGFEPPVLTPELPTSRCEEGDPDCAWILVDIPNPANPEGFWICDCNPPPPAPTLTNDCGCPLPSNRRWPAGCVQVDDDGDDLGVWNVRVRVRNGFLSSRRTHTNEDGCWQIRKEHKGNVAISLRFRNQNTKARHLSFWAGTRTVRDALPLLVAPPYNNVNVFYDNGLLNNVSPERQRWLAAHAVTRVEQLRRTALDEGVTLPPRGLNIIFGEGARVAAGAPMLENRSYSSWTELALLLNPITAILASISVPFRPDIWMPHDAADNAQDIREVLIHELGHAIHYGQVGEPYWFPYRDHIVVNGGWGQAGNFAPLLSSPNEVALGEAIGSFAGAWYGGARAGGEFIDFGNGFVPVGLMWDLIDDQQDAITNPATMAVGVDQVEGFTPAMIFQATGTGVRSIPAFGAALDQQNLANTPNTQADYDNLINLYDAL